MKKIVLIVLLLPTLIWAQEDVKQGAAHFANSIAIGPEAFVGNGWEVGYSQPWFGCVDWVLSLTQQQGTTDPQPTTDGISNTYRSSVAWGCKVHGEFAARLSAGLFAQVGLQAQWTSAYLLAPLTAIGKVPHNQPLAVAPLLRGGAVLDVRLSERVSVGIVGDCVLKLDEATFNYFSTERLACSVGVRMGFHF